MATKMCILKQNTKMQQKQQQQHQQPKQKHHQCKPKQHTQQQKQQPSHQVRKFCYNFVATFCGNINNNCYYSCCSAKSTNGGFSPLSKLNLIFLLLLLFGICCDVCKTQNINSKLKADNIGSKNFANKTSPVGVIDQIKMTFDNADYNNNSNNTNNVSSSSTTAASLDVIYEESSRENGSKVDATIEISTRFCLQRCNEEDNLFLDAFGIKCTAADTSDKCFKTRCLKGCEHWWRALKEFETCQEACSSTQFYPYDLPCISACEMAQGYYWHLQRRAMARIVHTTPPILWNDTEPPWDSLITLQWPITLPDNYLASRPFNIQYQYAADVHERRRVVEAEQQEKVDERFSLHNESIQEQYNGAGGTGAVPEKEVEMMNTSQWWNLADYNCNENFECEILDGLVPYTSYRFRFQLQFGDNPDNVLYSPPTSIYRTPAGGAPISSPIITEVLAMDHSHVAVFWQRGKFSNDELKGYRLVMQDEKQNGTVEKLLPPNLEHTIINSLSPHTTYTLYLAMLNEEGDGPNATATVVTEDQKQTIDIFEDLKDVLLIGEYSIKLQSLQSVEETEMLFESTQLISDVDFYLAAQQVFVIDEMGGVLSFFLNNTMERHMLPINMSLIGLKPSKIAVDWLNRKLFIAGESHSNKTWSIVTLTFNGELLKMLATNLASPIEQLIADPINGWLFWLHTNGLSRLNLATDRITEIIISDGHFNYFINDFRRHLLTTYNKSDNSLYELSYDGQYYRKLHLNLKRLLQGELQSFMQFDGVQFLATNGTHLMQYNYQESKIFMTELKGTEWCWRLLPMFQQQQQQHQLLQPTPMLEQAAPTSLQALVNSHTAHITWNAPKCNAFQSAASWQQWEYELEIMDVASNNAFNIRNIKTTYFNVEKLQANNLYKLRVRVAGVYGGNGKGSGNGNSREHGEDNLVGDWSEELQTRTWPLGEHKFILSSVDGLFETNEFVSQAMRIADLEMMQDFVQLNGTIFYITQDKHLKCANIMIPEVNCTFTAIERHSSTLNAVNLAYDWRGGKLYWTDALRNCIVRGNLDGSELELLPIFGAQNIEIDAYNGYIYYTTGKRLARRTLSTGVGGRVEEKEYFHVNGYGGHIRGFALDVLQQHLYWIVRQHEGHVRLFKMRLLGESHSQSQNAQLVDKLLAHDIEQGTLRYLEDIESLMWLVEDGKQVALMSATTLKDHAVIGLAGLPQITNLRLKTDYTPYLDLTLIPASVEIESIRIDDGYWDDFSIKWSPSITAENYTVFYRVLLEYELLGRRRFHTMEVTEPFIRFTEFQQSQVPVNISITPHTFWRAGATTHAQLLTPAAAPTQPKHLRIFVQRIDRPLELTPNISAILRWEPPQNSSLTNGVSYKVFCWLGEEVCGESVHNISKARPLEAVVTGLQLGETYNFQVQSHAPGRLYGAEKTGLLTLHIDPELQSVPRLIYATSELIGELDLDLNTRRVLVPTPSAVEHLTAIHGEARLLWVNENVELMSFVQGATPVKLARMRAEVLALTVDWISRIIYWAEKDTDQEHAVSVFMLELCRFEGRVMLGTKVFTTKPGTYIKDLLVLPYSQLLLWLEYELGTRNATLNGRSLADGSTLSLKAPTQALLHMFEGALNADLETVHLVDFKGKICAYDVQRQLCNPLKLHYSTSSQDSVRDIARDAGYLYVLKNDTIRAYNRHKKNLEYLVDATDIRQIYVYNSQQYPERKCLLPDDDLLAAQRQLEPPILDILEESFVLLQFPKLNTNHDCWLPVPGVKYMLTISEDTKNVTRNFTTYTDYLNITNLKPYTKYSLRWRASTYYQQKLEFPILQSDAYTFRTAIGTPTAPRDFTAHAWSPTEIFVSWTAPEVLNCAAVTYQLHWQAENTSLTAQKSLEVTNYTLENLEPAQEYKIWLNVYANAQKFNKSTTLTVKTFEEPEPVTLMESNAYNLTLSWLPSHNLTNVQLVAQKLNDVFSFSVDVTEQTHQILLTELEPKTKYVFHLVLTYAGTSRPYIWPEHYNERFIFETLGDCPSSPGTPEIEHITGEIFKVYWEPARDNGAPIVEYSLEALQIRPWLRKKRNTALSDGNNVNSSSGFLDQLPWLEEPEPNEDKWIVYCNTTELSCIVRDMHTLRLVLFRVRARNVPYGWGPYSNHSIRISEPFVTPEKRDSLVFAIIAPAVIVSGCVLALVLVRFVHKRRSRSKELLKKSRPSIWSDFSVLQQQQLMGAHNRGFSFTSHHSPLCNARPLSDADIALLPQINWSQITLLNFLGSGAFGEVYEGLVKYEDEEEQEKVAIKSLRKGASEFSELLQEAQLMSNFKHENIVRLIGICVDTESVSIIMEFMEGGDLLSYLRESRPNSSVRHPHAYLQLLDLITMCIDVANGCSYLEDMHFVHRDLACRNCLVSSRDPLKRVVKIGDFGLARDIYKNDYYRKEGEGLLPVRWMAPESLIDGVFTTQTDIWSFAVLCWEILTLGQQPYAARNNFEVLSFVKDGGRLEQPDNCPDKLFDLMQQCWHLQPEERPTFRRCLTVLLGIKVDVRHISMGFNVEDFDDYAVYTSNQSNVVLSSFKPVKRTLPQTKEEPVDGCDADDDCAVSVLSTDKADLKVRFENSTKDADSDTANDESQLIAARALKDEDTNTNYYINEGISRL